MNRFTVISLAALMASAVACGDDETGTTGPGSGGAGAEGGGVGGTGATGATGAAGGTGGMAALCGDGTLEGSEACDDGNTAADDGCDADCAEEAGWGCDGASPTVCTPICGDGVIAGDEACDDGGTDADDGCDATCEVELGWSCAGEPSTCMTGCGDGIVAGTEECDDGAMVDGDGCSMACAVESGWTCAGDPSVCELLGSCTSPIAVTGDGFTWQAPNLIAYGDDLTNADASCTGNDDEPGMHPDVVFEVTLAAGQNLGVTDAGAADLLFHVLDGNCDSASACLASFDGINSAEASTGLVYESATAQTVFVVIDSYFENPDVADDVDLLFEISTCGDGMIGPGEGCDDGNTATTDGCSDLCEVETGFLCTGEPSVCGPIPGSCSNPVAVTGDDFQFAGTNIQQYVDDEDYDPPSSCVNVGSTGGYDIVFEVALLANETVLVTEFGGLDSVLHILTAGQCAGGSECVASVDGGSTAEQDGITYTASAAETVYAVLESYGNPSSTTTFDLRIEKYLCGDGLVTGAEGCDDGNTGSGDGCSDTCAVEAGFLCTGSPAPTSCAPTPAATCAAPVVATGDNFRATGSNLAAFGDDENYTGPPGCATVSSSGTPPDAVFRVDLLAGDTIHVTELGTLDTVVHILDAPSCAGGSSCAASFDNDEEIGMYYTAQANGPVYVVLESWIGSPTASSTFDLSIELVSVCGDSTVEAAESCDDGNLVDGDGCSSICQSEAVTIISGCVGTVVSGVATPVPVGIPNSQSSGGAVATINMAQTGTILSMAIAVSAQHTADDNLDIWLEGPNGGGERDVSTDNGASGVSYWGTLFQDGAPSITSGSAPFTGVFAPEQPFAVFDGQSVTGTWTLRVADDAGTFDHGTLAQWDIAFCVMP